MSSALGGLAQRAARALTEEELAETARDASALMLQETHEWWVLLSFQGCTVARVIEVVPSQPLMCAEQTSGKWSRLSDSN